MINLAATASILWALAATASAQDILRDEDQRAVSRVVFSPDGTLLASGGLDASLRIWDLAKKSTTAKLTGLSEITGIAFLAGGKQLVACDYGGKVKLWELADKKELKEIETPGGLLNLEVAPDGKKAYLGSKDACIYVWDLQKASGAELPQLASENTVYGLAASRDGKILVHADGGGGVFLWNAESSQLIKQGKHKLSITWVAIAPDGKTFFSGGQDGGLKLWDAATGDPKDGFKHADSEVRSIVFTPDGKKLLIGTSDGHLKAINPSSGAVEKDIAAHEGAITSVSISPDGKKVATGCMDFTIKIWPTP